MCDRRHGAEHYAAWNAGFHRHSLRLNSLLTNTLSTCSLKVTDIIACQYITAKSMIKLGLQILTVTVPFYLVFSMGKEVEAGGHAISA
jgi:hypothetical protein